MPKLEGPGPNPSGLCMCGCGQMTRLAPQGISRLGWVAGKPTAYLNGHNDHDVVDVGYTIRDMGYTTPCWIGNGGRTGAGYTLMKTAPRTPQVYIHRVMYERVNGPIPEGLELDHLCRQRACCNPEHLEPVTHIENVRRGSATKLTAARVLEIRELLARGVFHREIARRFGIGKTSVGSIATGLSWRDVV